MSNELSRDRISQEESAFRTFLTEAPSSKDVLEQRAVSVAYFHRAAGRPALANRETKACVSKQLGDALKSALRLAEKGLYLVRDVRDHLRWTGECARS